MSSVVMLIAFGAYCLIVFLYCFAECIYAEFHYVECRYAECHGAASRALK
jgi:hypothetical protein